MYSYIFMKIIFLVQVWFFNHFDIVMYYFVWQEENILLKDNRNIKRTPIYIYIYIHWLQSKIQLPVNLTRYNRHNRELDLPLIHSWCQKSPKCLKNRYFTRKNITASKKFRKLYWICNNTIYLAEKIAFKRVSHDRGGGVDGAGGKLSNPPGKCRCISLHWQKYEKNYPVMFRLHKTSMKNVRLEVI